MRDPCPLIHVCDRYDYVEELTQHLYSNNMLEYIVAYVTQMSRQKTPKVIGKLSDLNCNEDDFKRLLKSFPKCPVEDLVDEVDKRNHSDDKDTDVNMRNKAHLLESIKDIEGAFETLFQLSNRTFQDEWHLELLQLKLVGQLEYNNTSRKHYDTLGIKSCSDSDKVKLAYRKLFKFHPDKAKSERQREEYTEKFQLISAAYDILKDPLKKCVYDKYINPSTSNVCAC